MASTAASTAFFLSRSMWRKMFSNTTTASSTIRPVASAKPPSDIVLIVNPHIYTSANVEMIDVGMDNATTSVLRMLRRKNSRIRTASMPPMIAQSRTLFTDCRTNLRLIVGDAELEFGIELLDLFHPVKHAVRGADRVHAALFGDRDADGRLAVEAGI